jgi:hypothetical protein
MTEERVKGGQFLRSAIVILIFSTLAVDVFCEAQKR